MLIQQEMANRLAIECLRAIASLGGLDGRCLEQPEIRMALNAMISPYLCRKLSVAHAGAFVGAMDGLMNGGAQVNGAASMSGAGAPRVDDDSEVVAPTVDPDVVRARDAIRLVLKLLNVNSETPYIIWDNSTRAELTNYLKQQEERIIRTVFYIYLY